MKVTVYGASDDLIELDGDISDEFQYVEDEPNFVAFSDGTLLEVTYTQTGRWKLSTLTQGAETVVATLPASGDDGKRADGTPAYSDVVTLDGVFQWAVVSHQRAIPGENADRA